MRPAAPREGTRGLQHGLVLDPADNYLATSGGLERFGRAPDGEIVGLRSPGREDHLGRLPADQRGYRPACDVERALGLLPVAMDARGIADQVPERSGHRLDHGIRRRRRGVVIEINPHLVQKCSILAKCRY